MKICSGILLIQIKVIQMMKFLEIAPIWLIAAFIGSAAMSLIIDYLSNN